MTDRWRVFANLATLANALLGIGAVLYILAGNKLWAMLLIGSAIGFDGLDGIFSRRSRTPGTSFGRIADSVADAITFGVAPAFLIAVHTSDPSVWQPVETYALVLAAAYLTAAVARLVYFTARAYQRSDFLGVPTPQSALAIVVAILFHDTPGFQTVQPVGLFVGVAVLALLMVLPIPYPKIRRGSPLRWPMVATAVAAGLSLLLLQFHPASGTLPYEVALLASYALLVGVASYYLLGPFTVKRASPEA
ncbi:MAG TPA: CDP-alcohol phosphatidyltransferase family protein [Thermoplasmata archaeon]|nr:CDP-alcohol phosphatidyltransferase family protein [Thermoplasmata archaeon]